MPKLKASLPIILLTLAVYAPAIQNGFIWDDDTLLTENPLIRQPDGLSQFWWGSKANVDYYPLTMTSLWLEWRLWGLHAAGYHLTNILLHAASSVLIWLVLARLSVPGAYFTGLLFAVHSVGVESVAWIAERKNTLSMLLYVVTLLLYLRYENDSRVRWYALALGTFLLALLSKTSVVMLPAVLLLCAWWQRGRIDRKDILRSVPFFGLSLIFGVITIWYQSTHILGTQSIHHEGFFARFAAAGQVIWFYLYKALLPINLLSIYPSWNTDGTCLRCFFPDLILIGCFGLFWWSRKTWGRPLLFGMGYFVITLFPVLGFFDIRFVMDYLPVADHFQYISIVGIIALVMGGIASLRISYAGLGMAPRISATLLIALFAVLTWQQVHIYKDEETFWRAQIARGSQAWVAYYALGVALAHQGIWSDAITHYFQALGLKPDSAETHHGLGFALARQGKLDEAVQHFSAAVKIKPYSAEAHYNLGLALAKQQNLTAAISHYSAALDINPNYAEAHHNLGTALASQEKLAEAIRHYSEAVQVEPTFTEAHYGLGRTLGRYGKTAESIDQYRITLRLLPNHIKAMTDLAWIFATNADPKFREASEAIRLAEQACEQTSYKQPLVLDTLAAAYAEAGRFNDAEHVAQRALASASSAGEDTLAQGIQHRLDLYKAGMPYHASTTLER